MSEIYFYIGFVIFYGLAIYLAWIFLLWFKHFLFLLVMNYMALNKYGFKDGANTFIKVRGILYDVPRMAGKSALGFMEYTSIYRINSYEYRHNEWRIRLKSGQE
jgi:hypothetical protein